MSALLPTYMTGQSLDVYQISDFSVMTMVNASANTGRTWVSFTFVLLNSMLALFAIYIFWSTSMRLKHNRL